MKIKKSELRQMIREAIQEELQGTTRLTEGSWGFRIDITDENHVIMGTHDFQSDPLKWKREAQKIQKPIVDTLDKLQASMNGNKIHYRVGDYGYFQRGLLGRVTIDVPKNADALYVMGPVYHPDDKDHTGKVFGAYPEITDAGKAMHNTFKQALEKLGVRVVVATDKAASGTLNDQLFTWANGHYLEEPDVGKKIYHTTLTLHKA